MEMPRRIWADPTPYSFPGHDPAWLYYGYSDGEGPTTLYVRADVADALAEALRETREFIRAEYESPRAQALEGELLSADARPIWNTLCTALTAYEDQT